MSGPVRFGPAHHTCFKFLLSPCSPRDELRATAKHSPSVARRSFPAAPVRPSSWAPQFLYVASASRFSARLRSAATNAYDNGVLWTRPISIDFCDVPTATESLCSRRASRFSFTRSSSRTTPSDANRASRGEPDWLRRQTAADRRRRGCRAWRPGRRARSAGWRRRFHSSRRRDVRCCAGCAFKARTGWLRRGRRSAVRALRVRLRSPR